MWIVVAKHHISLWLAMQKYVVAELALQKLNYVKQA